jgi:hypothetical protein
MTPVFEVFSVFIVPSGFVFNRTTNEAELRGHSPRNLRLGISIGRISPFYKKAPRTPAAVDLAWACPSKKRTGTSFAKAPVKSISYLLVVVVAFVDAGVVEELASSFGAHAVAPKTKATAAINKTFFI